MENKIVIKNFKKLEKKIRKETGTVLKQTDFSRSRFYKIDTKAEELSQLYGGESEGWKMLLKHAYSLYLEKKDINLAQLNIVIKFFPNIEKDFPLWLQKKIFNYNQLKKENLKEKK